MLCGDSPTYENRTETSLISTSCEREEEVEEFLLPIVFCMKIFNKRSLITPSVYVEFMFVVNIPCLGANGIGWYKRTEQTLVFLLTHLILHKIQ